ncbi:hypothetical protein [Bradyrhizobium sp. Ash2021]|uniref:hypothetical protein n=1 Tax=Bradyrhizobium sp. Ash2021 TaxID=2954771 RepID=UPI002815A41A|nr:hypothetical protein [Bradyrhizobium sp. Ash2021]WMT75042.1 hypothetical protein NL528_00950 [Bradyrhizobium sp. Ash2021]
MRQIIEGEYFAVCVERLGGYRAIDHALETIIEALMQNPGFPLTENDWCKIRYARTAMIEAYIPPLVVAFTITDDNDVILQWAEIADDSETPDFSA